MLLTITSSAEPATDLGFLLHKHPGRVQSFDVSVDRAHVFYPEATERRCTAALLLEVDPIELVRGKRFGGHEAFALAQYVNDRPYAASSMLAVAMAKVFRTAMADRCDARPDLPGRELPLEIHLPSLPCHGGVDMAQRVFAPLGWTVHATPISLDPEIPRWGDSRYVDLRLTGTMRLADALHHLYVMLPVLDNAKHYWVSTDEVDKLIRAGAGWLHSHPDRDLITARYLAHQRELVATAVGRLAEVDDTEPEALDNAVPVVALVGVSGSGKSTFARTHFGPFEVLSSDFCRGLVCVDRNAARADRTFGDHVIRRQTDQLRRSLRSLSKEGFRKIHVLRGVEEVEAAHIVREKLRTDYRHETGPFDVIGDIHGCRAELETLLTELGYAINRDEHGRPVDAAHPKGRRALFLGDLVDRGPDSPGVLQLVMGMVGAGHAFAVPGNHEHKLVRPCPGATCRSPTGWRRLSNSSPGNPRSSGRRCRRSATTWSPTWCSTAATSSSHTPG